MCHFISWIDLEGHLYYLTSKEIHSKRGKELKDYLGSAYAEDVVGHGAIDWYFDLKGRGVHKECTDFSSPANFPDEIVKAIKSGAFKGMGLCPEILNESARAEYERIKQPALADFQRIKQSAWADFQKITLPAWADYQKIIQSAWADERIEQSAWADYGRIKQSALADFQEIEQSARADYQKIEQSTFWRLAIDTKNRITAWA